MSEYYVESALLGQGLTGISTEEMCRVWPFREEQIVWMEEGVYRIGTLDEFCRFAEQAENLCRVNYQNFENCCEKRESGVLTASGTIRVCRLEGKSLAVTCGMGGLYSGQEKEACHDIMALLGGSVSLIAASPKDMFDLQWTIQVMEDSGIPVYGRTSPWCDGYLFNGQRTPIPVWKEQYLPEPGSLLLNGIPEELRITDKSILEEAVAYGRTQVEFHPAVNRRLKECTGGRTSWIQLEAMIDNVRWARELTR